MRATKARPMNGLLSRKRHAAVNGLRSRPSEVRSDDACDEGAASERLAHRKRRAAVNGLRGG